MPIIPLNPSGIIYSEHYLYSEKAWEMAPSGASYFDLQNDPLQNAPIVVTSSGYETTTPDNPWAKTDGYGKYEKVGFGYFDLTPSGAYDPYSKQFSLHPQGGNRVVFNGVLTENVYIEYEAGPSGYYLMDSIDYNPVRNEVSGGFVHFSEITAPETIFITASQDSIRADGRQGCMLTVSLLDADFDRVPDKDVVIVIDELLPAEGGPGVWSELGTLTPSHGSVSLIDASGSPYGVIETTNRRGECSARYNTIAGKTGIVQVKAYVLDNEALYDTVNFAQFYYSAEPFVLDLSLLDTLDYLT